MSHYISRMNGLFSNDWQRWENRYSAIFQTELIVSPFMPFIFHKSEKGLLLYAYVMGIHTFYDFVFRNLIKFSYERCPERAQLVQLC